MKYLYLARWKFHGLLMSAGHTNKDVRIMFVPASEVLLVNPPLKLPNIVRAPKGLKLVKSSQKQSSNVHAH